MISEQALAMLPASIKELVEIIGLDATLTLIEAFGGSRLYIPKIMVVGKRHHLDCVDPNVRSQLISAFGGLFLQIPRAASFKKFFRNQQIAEACETTTVKNVARKFDLTERHVWSILKKSLNNFRKEE